MKRVTYILLAISSFFVLTAAVAWNSSSPGKKTGSPGDGKNCTQCHTGTATFQSGWITSDIPASGYVAGQTYTITVSGTHTGVNMFGFECTAEDANNNKVGSFIITNATETRYPPNMTTSVTHTNAGTAASGGSKNWSFDWTAPAAGTGTVTFYAAINAANGNMGQGGDIIYLTNLAVDELGTDITDPISQTDLLVYPNPAEDEINISYTNISSVAVYNANGKRVKEITSVADNHVKIDIRELEKGVYYLSLITDNETKSSTFVKL